MMPLNVAESFTSPQVAINNDLGNCSLKLYNLFCIQKILKFFVRLVLFTFIFCVEDYLCGNRLVVKNCKLQSATVLPFFDIFITRLKVVKVCRSYRYKISIKTNLNRDGWRWAEDYTVEQAHFAKQLWCSVAVKSTNHKII